MDRSIASGVEHMDWPARGNRLPCSDVVAADFVLDYAREGERALGALLRSGLAAAATACRCPIAFVVGLLGNERTTVVRTNAVIDVSYRPYRTVLYGCIRDRENSMHDV